MFRKFCYMLIALVVTLQVSVASVPTNCSQAVIGIAEGWNSSHVTLSVVEKNASGQWVRVLGPFKGRLGRNGLVWGLGIHANPGRATVKREGDGRSPAGVFAIGGLWVTNKNYVKHHRSIPYVKVGPNDLWVSDVNYPKLYNRHIRLDHPARTEWELREQMRQTDYAHSIKLLICHNTAERRGGPVVGAGSSIFFHIWRKNGGSPTAGCTAMAEANLRAIIARLQPSRHPVYILLPHAEYARLRQSWRLP
ncbi:MAG: hypothetical protein IJA63_10980 [Akkermansia sp.]|nr:hypothetical protein [Akkermansia sp.]